MSKISISLPVNIHAKGILIGAASRLQTVLRQLDMSTHTDTQTRIDKSERMKHSLHFSWISILFESITEKKEKKTRNTLKYKYFFFL